MHIPRYWPAALVALGVGLGAVWLHALGESAAHLRALLEAVPDSRVAPSARERVDSPRAVPRAVTAPSPEPPPYGGGLHDDTRADGALQGAPLEHPEVTDPRMRRILKAAWDD